MMWRRYKQRVLLAMSSQAFAQLVRVLFEQSALCRAHFLLAQNGINGTLKRN